MKDNKPSGSAIFMYAMIALTFILAIVFLTLYYANILRTSPVLWTGIVSFMIFYQFGLRILFGNITKLLKTDYNNLWFKEKKFEKKLYKFLRVKKWKLKVLTFDPDSFNLKYHSLEEIAHTMAKSELDHWINEIISLTGILFTFIWGCFPAFLITAILAMLFDLQFIIIQRYNRPHVLRLIKRQNKKACSV